MKLVPEQLGERHRGTRFFILQLVVLDSRGGCRQLVYHKKEDFVFHTVLFLVLCLSIKGGRSRLSVDNFTLSFVFEPISSSRLSSAAIVCDSCVDKQERVQITEEAVTNELQGQPHRGPKESTTCHTTWNSCRV